MEQYDYSERISHNEQRIAELKGKLYTTKMSIKALEKENERCFGAMNNLTHVIDTSKTKKDKQILELTQTVEELKQKNKQLSEEKKQLKDEFDSIKQKLEHQINNLQVELARNLDQRVISTDKFYENNIFEELLKTGGK